MQAEQMANLLRLVRHDFANHLQVISGYLDIGQAEKARQYLGGVIEDLGMEKIVFASRSGEAALYFYEQLLKVRGLGINLRYEDLAIDGWEVLKASGEPYHSVADLNPTVQGAPEEPIVYLSIYEDQQGIDMFFSWAGWEQDPPRIRISKE